MDCNELEKEIRATGADVAPRITYSDLAANIAYETYFTAEQGNLGACVQEGSTATGHPALGLLTFCVLVLRNGFTVTGESACASPENFNYEIVTGK